MRTLKATGPGTWALICLVIFAIMLAILAGCAFLEGAKDGAKAEVERQGSERAGLPVPPSPPPVPPSDENSPIDTVLYMIGSAVGGWAVGKFIRRKDPPL